MKVLIELTGDATLNEVNALYNDYKAVIKEVKFVEFNGKTIEEIKKKLFDR